jgi:pimeloyl-ACP methyl ester carboxylesterase
MQAHGHTADIDRPLTLEQMADDTAAVIRYLGFERADLFGYSNGGAIALRVALQQPGVVRKLVLASIGYRLGGIHPGLMEGLGEMKPEMMYGSPWHEEYLRIAPRPQDFATLFTKKQAMDRAVRDISPEAFRSLKAPVLLIAGDSDLITPEHAVEMFRLLGGGVFGDAAPMPASQLAILPGTSHVGVADRAEMLLAMIPPFLDAPMPESR